MEMCFKYNLKKYVLFISYMEKSLCDILNKLHDFNNENHNAYFSGKNNMNNNYHHNKLQNKSNKENASQAGLMFLNGKKTKSEPH